VALSKGQKTSEHERKIQDTWFFWHTLLSTQKIVTSTHPACSAQRLVHQKPLLQA